MAECKPTAPLTAGKRNQVTLEAQVGYEIVGRARLKNMVLEGGFIRRHGRKKFALIFF